MTQGLIIRNCMKETTLVFSGLKGGYKYNSLAVIGVKQTKKQTLDVYYGYLPQIGNLV